MSYWSRAEEQYLSALDKQLEELDRRKEDVSGESTRGDSANTADESGDSTRFAHRGHILYGKTFTNPHTIWWFVLEHGKTNQSYHHQ